MHARTPKELDRKVNILHLMREHYGIERDAANAMIARGQVSIDGYTLHRMYVKGHWRVRQLEGRMMKVGTRGEVRLFGSRKIEQLELGGTS
jgi:hypothetical protein